MSLQIIVLIISCHYTLQQLPTELQEESMTAASGISTNIEITCGFEQNLGPAFWVVNDTIYDLYTNYLPCVERDGLYGIRIKTVPLYFDNTTFQCLSSKIHQPGRVLRLFVREVFGIRPAMLEDCQQQVMENANLNLNIDLCTIVTDSHHTIFQFSCYGSSDISLKVNKTIGINNINKINEVSYISQTCCEVNVSNSEISSNENVTALLLLENSMGCTNGSRYITIYDHPTKHDTFVNRSVCIPQPDITTQCNMKRVFLVFTETCKVPIFPTLFTLNKVAGCEGIQSVFNLTVDNANDSAMVCLYQKNFDIMNTLVHFACTPVAPDGRLIYHIMSSYELIADISSSTTTNFISTTQTTTVSSGESQTSPSTLSTNSTYLTTTTSPPNHTITMVIIVVVCIVVGLLAFSVIAAIVAYYICYIKKNTGKIQIQEQTYAERVHNIQYMFEDEDSPQFMYL